MLIGLTGSISIIALCVGAIVGYIILKRRDNGKSEKDNENMMSSPVDTNTDIMQKDDVDGIQLTDCNVYTHKNDGNDKISVPMNNENGENEGSDDSEEYYIVPSLNLTPNATPNATPDVTPKPSPKASENIIDNELNLSAPENEMDIDNNHIKSQNDEEIISDSPQTTAGSPENDMESIDIGNV